MPQGAGGFPPGGELLPGCSVEPDSGAQFTLGKRGPVSLGLPWMWDKDCICSARCLLL